MDAANQKHKHCAELERLSLEFAGRLLDLYLPTLETSLLEMADAERGEQQMLLLSLVRELKAKRVDITVTFKQYLSDGFALFERSELGGKAEAEEDLSTDLSLIANDELEQELAAKSISRRAAARCSELLQALDQRMAVVNGGQRLPEDGNPLGPYQFANALRDALRIISLDGPMPLQVYRLFEKRLTGQLEPFYKAANQYLIDNDVLPNLRARRGTIKKAAEPAVPAKEPVSPAPAQEEKPASAQPAVNSAAESELYQAIRQIQQGGPAGQPYR